MNIALLSYEYPTETGFGGIGTYSYYHARALVRLGHTVHVFAGSNRPGVFHAEHDGVRVTRLKVEGRLHRLLAPARARRYWFPNRIETAYAAYTGLRQAIDRENFDIVEAPECGGDAAAVALRLDVPLAVRFHSPARLIMGTYDRPWIDRELTALVEQVAIGRAVVRTACSAFVAREVQSVMGVREPVHVVPNGIDLELFDRDEGIDVAERFNLPRQGLTVFFANRMEPRKGIHVVADVAIRVLHKYPHVHFVLAGRDPFRHLETQVLPAVRARGLGDRFHALGGLDLQDVRAILKRSAVFLLPSTWENCPYSCIEAMAARCAIVSSDCGGMPELIAHGANGLLARTGDAGSFVEQLEQLIEAKELRERLGTAARATVEQRLTDVDVARRTVDLYASAAPLRSAQSLAIQATTETSAK